MRHLSQRSVRKARPWRPSCRGASRRGIRILVLLAVVVVAGIAALFPRTASVDTTARAAQIREVVRKEASKTRAEARNVRAEGAGLSRAKQRDWFRQAGFGIFIHYGPSSALKARTTKLWFRGITSKAFKTTAKRSFRPAPDAAEQWVRLAKAAGAKYLTVTVKHHDGFGLWDSKFTDWDVGPGHDLLRPLARACKREGIKLFFYYPLIDLHEPTFMHNWPAYDAFMRGQVRELLTRYGPVAGIWFDWPQGRPFADWHLERLYRLVHALQPWALVATNHHRRPLVGEDFQIFEGVFPGNPGPDGIVLPISSLPHETAMKVGTNWYYGGTPNGYKRATVSKLLKEAAARNTNLLFDVPPRPDGMFDKNIWAALSGIFAQAQHDG